MTIILIVTLVLLGQEKPIQHTEKMASIEICEQEAHKVLTHQFAKEVEERIKFRSAACGMITDLGQPI